MLLDTFYCFLRVMPTSANMAPKSTYSVSVYSEEGLSDGHRFRPLVVPTETNTRYVCVLSFPLLNYGSLPYVYYFPLMVL